MKDNFRLLTLALLMLLCSQVAMANCGTTDYSGNTGRLYDMVTYVLTMCSYVAQLMYAIATLLSLPTSILRCKLERKDSPRA